MKIIKILALCLLSCLLWACPERSEAYITLVNKSDQNIVYQEYRDFGHTFSPIIEMQDCENILHGEAVALDCFLSSCIAFSRNIISECELKRISSLYFHLKFPQILTCNKDFLWESVLERKKHRGGLQRIPFPTEIGRYAFINDLTKCDIENGIEIMCKLLTKKK